MAKGYSLTSEAPTKQRLRITFGKLGALKYTSNLDIAKVWERVLRRADLPLLYTQGFNTRPRIQLASALPLGISSECELLDVSLREVLPTLDGLAERILSVSPSGLAIYEIVPIPTNSSALQTLLRSARYRIRFEDGIEREVLQAKIDEMLASDSMVKVRQRKNHKKESYDIRPLIYGMDINADGDLIAHLAVGDHGNLRPDELLEEMDLHEVYTTIHRFQLYFEKG